MKYKKIISSITASIFLFSLSTGMAFKTFPSNVTLYNNNIGEGINYKKQLVTEASTKRVLNILSCDLNSTGANIMFSKAKDIEKKEEILSKQIQREIFKGNNVVAGINGDMFDMGIGYSSGPQVRDGAILTNHNAKSEENIYPVFGLDYDKKAFITYLHMDGKLILDNAGSNGLNSVTSSGVTITTNGAITTAGGISIDSVNRENCKDKLVLNDYQLNQSGKVDLTPYISKGFSAATVVKGINEPIKLGKEYVGTVESVGLGAKSVDIPKGGVLLCSTGTKAQWMNNHLKSGDRVKIQINYDRPNIKEAIGVYTYFLRNGRVLSNDEMIKAGAKAELVKARKARTALGITADNKVIAITVDGGTPSKGISDGITLYEMANLLKSLGAVNGVGMDGGGSTEMDAKLYGENSVNILTKPSDGRERALTNGIMFLSNNERTYSPQSISLNGDISIFKNTAYKFKVSGMDTNYNRLDLTNASINWSLNQGIGTIDGDGLFRTGQTAGSGKVTAALSSIYASANIRVLSDVAGLKLTDTKTVPLTTNVNRQFKLDARDENGNPIIIDNGAAAWSVTGGIGTIDKNGLLSVTAKSGSGAVTAVVGSKKATVNVAIMQDVSVIDDFEHNDYTRYAVNGFIGGVGSISKDFAKSGSYSYKISYDYDKAWDRKSSGTINLVPTYIDKDANDTYSNYTSDLRPKKLGMWIYGDGHAPALKATFTDGEGNLRTVDVIKNINFVGWKYIDVDMPSDIPCPITLNSLYFLETNKVLHSKGDIYFDDIKYVYSDITDLKPPTFSGFSPSGTIYLKNTNISVKISDPSGIEKNSIFAKLDGRSIPVNYDESSGVISYNAVDLTKGVHSFEARAMDGMGNSANPPFSAKFTVSDETDTKAPTITTLLPSNKSIIKTSIPRISFKLKDDRSGIDVNDISILLDGIKLKTYFDEASGYACAVPNALLNAGEHKLAVSAKDRAGNKLSLAPITFSVQTIMQPKNPNSFTVSVLSDSHATEYGSKIFAAAGADSSELVIQNGDMVDADTASQWTEGLRQLGLIKNKPVMASPGNHEASGGSLSDYIKYMGMPTYSFEYGNSLFVSLNSAIGQSISASDPTQFDYLQRVLEDNKKQNVFIYTHVPTRDNAGIDHAMPPGDVKRLEDILSNYKKLNSSKNINVIFGHLHSFQSWTVNGVNYTIDGNECLKNYVSTDKGGYMGYTRFVVSGDKVTRKFVPMPQSIAVMDGSIVSGVMKLVKGTNKKLNLYGDYNYSASDYIAPLNNINDVDINWESDNSYVASVSDAGVVTAKSVGSANIKATVLDKTYTFKIISMEQSDSYITGFKLRSDATSTSSDKPVKIRGFGYDIYGNSFEIDSSQIIWQASKGTISNGVYTPAIGMTTSEAIDITGSYKAFKTKLTINLSAVQVPKKYVKISAQTLNVRETPSTSGRVLEVLKLDDRVEVLGEDNEWFKIIINNITGYISKQYTKEE